MTSTRVAVVTCVRIPDPDPDEEPLLGALRAAGLDAQLVAWDDPRAPRDFDLFVLRSAWNYYEDPAGFLTWVADVSRSSRLLNAAEVVQWNHHKGYLHELAAEGIDVIPTALVRRGPSQSLAGTLAGHDWKRFVIKPAISAGSFATRQFGPGQERAAQTFFAEQLAQRDVLVQPYLPEIEDGERALIWIDGEPSHSVSKRPRFAGDEECTSQATPIAADEADFALEVLGAMPFELRSLLYARVDAVRVAGKLLLAELELIEPSLYLLEEPRALERLVRAIERHARRQPHGRGACAR